MKKMQIATWLQNKMVLAALLMVLVAGTAFAGVLALRSGDTGEQKETEPGYAFQTESDEQNEHQLLERPSDSGLQQMEQEVVEDIAQKETMDRPVQSHKIDAVSGDQDKLENGAEMDLQAEAETLVAGEDAVVYEPETKAEEVAAVGNVLAFYADSTMNWPVFGNVLLDYSMDSTIYFPTLKQYKCNPGILIQAQVGQPVAAAVKGQVTAVDYHEELGNYIVMDLGNEYTLCYGQLEEITVSVGQIVEQGQVLGVVAQPTKYYVVEGPNIYLEMRYQQAPIDPLDYIR